MGSSDGIKEALEKLTAEIKDLKTAQQEIKSPLDKLAPIVPVVDQLAIVPSKVVTLQSAAFDNAEQVRALNLALIRVENLQREGKAAVAEDADASDHSANFAPKAGSKQHKPPPECTRDWTLDQSRGGDEDQNDDNRFHPRVCLEFPTFDGKEEPLPWLNRCETFFRGQGTPETRRGWYAAMHLTGVAQLWYARLELTEGTPSWWRFA
jgi:hypothetical protein